MTNRRRKIASFLAFLLLTLSLCISCTSASLAEGQGVELPYFLNQFEGTPLNLKDYWGKAYLLFFFTENSQDCAKQIPEIKRIYESYSSDELQILMIHEWANETYDNTQNVITNYGLENLTFFEDEDMAVAKKINIPGCPMTIFMNEGGYLFDAFVYAVNYDLMAEVLDAMGVSRGTPTTPAPATPSPAPQATPEGAGDDAVMEPTSAAPTATADAAGQATPAPEAAATPLPFATKAPKDTGAPPLTPPPEEGVNGGTPFGSQGAVKGM